MWNDDVSQSLLALDKVIDEYDPYRLNGGTNGGPRPASMVTKAPPDDSRNEEIRKSLEALDSVLDEFDEGDLTSLSGSTRRASRPPSAHESASVIASYLTQPPPEPHGGLSRRHSGGVRTSDQDPLPPPPADLLRPGVGGAARPHSIHSSTGAELYTRSSKRNCRAPPQVPKRNPETRLSSGSSESQDPLDLAQFQDGNQGYGLTSQSSQEYSPKHGYHGYPGDNYQQQPPPARNGDVGHYHGHGPLGGAPPPAPSLPPGGGLPPPLPPGRKNHDSVGSMPGYPAPHFPPHQDSNGLGSVSPPPPPPGFDMGATISASTSQPEELYEKRLPTRMDELPASMLHGGSSRGSIGSGGSSSVGGEFENYYGAQLPPPGGLDNGYPSPHELYETTLPRPSPLQQQQPPSVLRRSSSSSSGSHKNSSSYAGSRETIMPPEMYGAPPHTASPEADFPPPPPPQFFQTMPSVPSAPSSMPGSPQRPPPPTLPKPRPGKPSQANGGPPPPPPPPLSTMPRANNHHAQQQYNAPPPPPPLSTMPPLPPQDVGGLAAQLQGFNLRSSPPEDKLTESPLVNAHSDLISQIHIGVTLRKSPAGKKIRGADEPRVDDSGDTFSETASVTSSGSGEDYSGSSTGSRAPPPTLPKPNKPSPIHTNTMPSGGTQSNHSNNSSVTSDDIDASEVGFEGSIPKSVDVTQIEGFTPVPDGCPDWKKAMIERKNNQLLDQARKVKHEKDKETEKWKGIPEWKKALIMEREKKKEDEQNPQEEELRRRREEEMRLQNMPDWKRALMMKKKGEL